MAKYDIQQKGVFSETSSMCKKKKSMGCGICVYTAKLKKTHGDCVEDKLLWLS